MNEDYEKFKQYWIELGKPDLEIKKKHEEDSQFVRRQLQEMEYFDPTLDYRLAGDRHWRLRKEWVDSDFKLPVEVQISNSMWFDANATPDWSQDREYRKKPVSKPEGSASDPETEVIAAPALQPVVADFAKTDKDVRVNWRTEFMDAFEQEQLSGIEINMQMLDPYKSYAGKVNTDDTGRHYRFVYDVVVTPEAAERGYVAVKLDPFRIAAIYGLTDFALQTILKKTLCAGNRGHNTLREDLEDIICAAQRKLEMLDEDETTPTIPENI